MMVFVGLYSVVVEVTQQRHPTVYRIHDSDEKLKGRRGRGAQHKPFL
jgi:hypothetical protein